MWFTPFVFSIALIKHTLGDVGFPDVPKDTTTPTQQRIAIRSPDSESFGIKLLLLTSW